VPFTVTDAWTGEALPPGKAGVTVSATVESHDVALLILEPVR